MTQIAHAERAHALLGASSSHRWLLCPPSARLEESLPDTESAAAKEGTLAHEISELKLRKQFVEPMGPQKFAAAMRKFKANPLYNPEMDGTTTTYLEYVQSIVHAFESAPYITIERKVDYSNYAQEGFGTADCIIIGGKHLHVIDYKHGKGVPVSAEDNPQMKLYALGALRAYAMLYDIETVHLAIVQPRVWERPSEWSLPAADLLAWGETVKPIAALAFAGEGVYNPGDHCGFCRAKETCRARVESLLSVEKYAPMKPPLISWSEVGDALRRAEGIVGWYNSLRALALSEVLKGGEVAGWKAVEGRGGRVYSNFDTAFAHLQANGIAEALLYVRQPLTPPAVEEMLGKKKYRELLETPGHVVKKPGAPTLAPIDDKRPAFSGEIKPEDIFSTPLSNEA